MEVVKHQILAFCTDRRTLQLTEVATVFILIGIVLYGDVHSCMCRFQLLQEELVLI